MEQIVMENNGNMLCKSVFKNGETVTTTAQFTLKWIELINRMERECKIYSNI